MGKHWRKYTNGRYSLGRLKGRAVAVWRDENNVKHRYRLDARTEAEGRSALDAFAIMCMKQDLDAAAKALAEGDVVEMMRVYESLYESLKGYHT